MAQACANHRKQSRVACWTTVILICVIIYVLSSGPVLALGFWLREVTGWNGFYGVMWIYFPLLAPGHWQPMESYIEWWVNLLGTVGPG